MGLSRQFLNLIVWEESFTARSLRCIDLRRLQLFHPDVTTAATAALATVDSTMRRTVIPSPTFSFKATQSEGLGEPGSNVKYNCSASCVPVAGRKVFCTDACGRSLLFDADTRQVVTMPTLPKFKWRPVSIFVPSADCHGDPDPDGTLFILPTKPKQERRSLGPQSDQFDALVYRRSSSMTPPSKSWHHQLLPPLPYLREPKYWRIGTWITSYAVIGGGSHICVSTNRAGTYCLDTVSHTWSKVGDWMLPFSGKAEYVPELNLWFGIGISDGAIGIYRRTDQLVAANLSTLNSKPEPEVVGTWQEFHDIPIHRFYTSKLVYLGSRRFCVARFISGSYLLGPSKGFVLFTGVEVTPQVLGSGGGESKLRMFRHKSRVAPPVNHVDHVF